MADSAKPEPLMADGKAYYTLNSYGPVSIEVYVPQTTDFDVEVGLKNLLATLGAADSDLDDQDFVRRNFEGCETREDVRALVRRQLEEANAGLSEDKKLTLVAQELAGRLEQRVPDDQVKRVREGLELQLRQQVAQSGVSWERFVAGSGGQGAIDQLLDFQARQVAEQDGALAAWAREKKLTVERQEIPRLLGVPLQQAQDFLDKVEAAGRLEDYREGALRAKAIADAAQGCTCTFHHESDEERDERVAWTRSALADRDGHSRDGSKDQKDGSGTDGSGPRLKLV